MGELRASCSHICGDVQLKRQASRGGEDDATWERVRERKREREGELVASSGKQTEKSAKTERVKERELRRKEIRKLNHASQKL